MSLSRSLLLTLCITGLPWWAHALDVDNAKRINDKCALCHGVYGQGTPGTLSPRLAGLSAEYLAKELKLYRSGERSYPAMTITSQLDSMSDKDIEDISQYLAGIDLKSLDLPKIPEYAEGDPASGEKEFMRECKGCHRKSGLGKLNKGIPPLAGQYGTYMFSQLKKFQSKDRYHDNDPEDETFDDYTDEELHDLIAFVTDLPPHPDLQRPATGTQLAKAISDETAAQPAESEIAALEVTPENTGIVDTPTVLAGMPAPPGPLPLPDAAKIAGEFRVTATGEIVLSPNSADLRALAGTSGRFMATRDGILFIAGE